MPFLYLILIGWSAICVYFLFKFFFYLIKGMFQDAKEISQEYKKEPRSASEKFMFVAFWLVLALLLLSSFFMK